MQIVGIDVGLPDGTVHTIDVWFSKRRAAWVLERLDANGDRVGLAHACQSLEEAEECLAGWLRAHGETHLVAPFEAKMALELAKVAQAA